MTTRRAYDRQGFLALQPGAFLEMFFPSPSRASESASGDVAVVNIRGPLDHHRGWWCDSYEEILERVDAACAGPAGAIVLRVDSPGGECAGAFDTARAIRERCAAAGKRLFSYVDGQACSAGYALACAAEQVHLSSAAIVGSIGVIATRVDVTAADAAEGVRVVLVTSGARKADGHPHSAVSDEELAETRTIVDALAAPFFELVAEFRGTTAAAVAALEAGMFVGTDAIARGLADVVGTFDSLLAVVASSDTASAGGAEMDEDEKKAREALQAIVDDKDADEKSKARARRALAAMDDDGEKDESAESEGDDEEGKKDDEEASAASAGASVSAATAGAIASQASSVEARLVALEREREAEKRSELLASRPDLAPGLVKVLSTKPLAEVKSIVAAIPAPKRPKLGDHAAAASATGTRGENQGGDGRGDQQPPAQAAAMDRAMGLASTKLGVKREGTRLFLGASLPAK